MIFHPTPVEGAWVVDIEPQSDDRGFFARTSCERDFAARGLHGRFVQCSLSFSPKKGTLRGLHYQAAPDEEAKLIRCTMGAIHDVVLDLRPGSPSFLRHLAVVLSAENRRMVYAPEGCAHGFQTLEHDTEVAYQMSAYHVPDSARGVRWDDPAFAIPWPAADRIVAPRDRHYPDFVRG